MLAVRMINAAKCTIESMQYRAHLLQVDSRSVGSIQYFLMLAQVPNDGHMENRTVIEGAHMGYLNANSLMDAFRRAKLAGESAEQLEKALALNVPLAFVGILILDSSQLRDLGFRTLAEMVDVLALTDR